MSMSSRSEEKSDLTTDALPSAPREETENPQNNEESDNKESNFEEINTNSSRTHTRKTKTRGFTRVKRMSPPTAYASIININNSSDVHVGTKVTYNLNRSEKSENKPEIVETSAIKNLRTNSNLATIDDLSFVATHIDERWQEVGRALKFSDGQIQKFIIDHKQYGIKEVIYQLLLDWLQSDPEPTVANLGNVLWSQNQQDAVKRWSERKQS